MTPAGKAWLVITGGIIAWECAVPREQLLSSAADRAIEKHPVGARVAILLAGTALTTHLANLHKRPDLSDVVSTDFLLWRRIGRSFS